MLCAIGAVASASVAVNAADLQLHLTELVAALIRPALACSRLAVAPQCRQRCALRTELVAALIRPALKAVALRRRIANGASWLLPSFDLL